MCSAGVPRCVLDLWRRPLELHGPPRASALGVSGQSGGVRWRSQSAPVPASPSEPTPQGDPGGTGSFACRCSRSSMGCRISSRVCITLAFHSCMDLGDGRGSPCSGSRGLCCWCSVCVSNVRASCWFAHTHRLTTATRASFSSCLLAFSASCAEHPNSPKTHSLTEGGPPSGMSEGDRGVQQEGTVLMVGVSTRKSMRSLLGPPDIVYI